MARQIPVVRPTPSPSSVCLTPAHTEDGPEDAQESGHLQQHQEQEVDSAERDPVGDTVPGNELPPWRGGPKTLLFLLLPVA